MYVYIATNQKLDILQFLISEGSYAGFVDRVMQQIHIFSYLTQILKNWHLMCIVIGICGTGTLLILARSIAQGVTDPQLVNNTENPEGTTVQL